MRLVIKQYLANLKESKELDAILPDLITEMGLTPICKPQVGAKQYGVDLAAVGNDPADKIKKLFLFVIKCGDLGRKDWDTGNQAIRPTLGEIQDSYIQICIALKHENLPIKVILVTGGNLLQDCLIQWNGYTKRNQTDNISYDFWGGDELAELFYTYLFNEHILIPEKQSTFRKVLVLLSDPSYKLNDYYKLFDEFVSKITKASSRNNKKKFTICKLILRIAMEWAKNENNYKFAIQMAEYSLLKFYDVIRKNDLIKKKVFIEEFRDLYLCLYNILIDNNDKFAHLYSKKNGLHGFSMGQSPEVEALNVYEQLGFLSELGVLIFFELNRYKQEIYLQSLGYIVENLKQLLQNHRCLLNPLFDSHHIEVVMSCYVLLVAGEKEFVNNWLKESIEHILYAVNYYGKCYPTCTNNFSELIYENKENKQEHLCSSTLLFYYLRLAALCDDENIYNYICKIIKENFSDTHIQYWYPDVSSEDFIYKTNISHNTGYSFIVNKIPDTIKLFNEAINQKKDKEIACKDFSCFKNGFTDLLFISNRHFRNPIIPDTLLGLKSFLEAISTDRRE